MSRITSDISLAVETLARGGVVAIPTETVYGLAANALDPIAVRKIFAIKNRPFDHPLIVHVSSLEHARQWGHFDDRALLLAKTFWPGPLTLLVPRTEIVPDWVTGARETVAIRIPNHNVTLEILTRLDFPLVAPSANRFGKVSPTTAAHVQTDLGHDVDLIVDGGPCNIGVESTIVECVDTLKILRPGAVTIEDINVVISLIQPDDLGQSRAPGMMASHYAPQAQVIPVDSASAAEELMGSYEARGESVRIISEPDVGVFARRIYDYFRQADIDGVSKIIVVLAPPHGLGIAINDRVYKAAAH